MTTFNPYSKKIKKIAQLYCAYASYKYLPEFITNVQLRKGRVYLSFSSERLTARKMSIVSFPASLLSVANDRVALIAAIKSLPPSEKQLISNLYSKYLKDDVNV